MGILIFVLQLALEFIFIFVLHQTSRCEDIVWTWKECEVQNFVFLFTPSVQISPAHVAGVQHSPDSSTRTSQWQPHRHSTSFPLAPLAIVSAFTKPSKSQGTSNSTVQALLLTTPLSLGVSYCLNNLGDFKRDAQKRLEKILNVTAKCYCSPFSKGFRSSPLLSAQPGLPFIPPSPERLYCRVSPGVFPQNPWL